MTRRPLRVAVTAQLETAARIAGFDTHVLPAIESEDINRSLHQRLADGEIYLPFLERSDIELVVDFNTAALTLSPYEDEPGRVCITPANLGIPYVSCLIDPMTSLMGEVPWADRWQVFESDGWIKCIWESAHAEELIRLGIPNVMVLPMAASDAEYDTSPLPEQVGGPALAFLGHPASSWFRTDNKLPAREIFPALTAAAVHADMPDVAFHKIFFDMYEFGQPPSGTDVAEARIEKALGYFNAKFLYSAYLAVKQRDRFARFLQLKLGDTFELVGDLWGEVYGLRHTPRIWNREELCKRMRRVPICLNLLKGCLESGLNLRHFEITASGGFMLTHYTPELESCFEVGVECDTFHNENDLLEKVAYYLEHPKKRRAIAQAGQRRTLSEHLYSHRLVRMVAMLREGGMLPRAVAPAGADGMVAASKDLVAAADGLAAAATPTVPFGLS